MKTRELIEILEQYNGDDEIYIIRLYGNAYACFSTIDNKGSLEFILPSPPSIFQQSESNDKSLDEFSRLWNIYYKMSWQARYNIYLNSTRWKVKRKKILRRDNYLCQSCLKEKATQVHHLTYARAGNEPLFDLTSVCQSCHEIITRDTRINNEKKFNEKYIFGSLMDWFIQELDMREDELLDDPEFCEFMSSLGDKSWFSTELEPRQGLDYIKYLIEE
jgi:hypothetical protein